MTDEPKLSAERLTEIRARCEKATQGPWVSEMDSIAAQFERTGTKVSAYWIADIDRDNDKGDEDQQSDRDADFIAHSREDVPWLIDRVEKAEADAQEQCSLKILASEDASLLRVEIDSLKRERELLTYWLVEAYLAAHREGWEDGPSEAVTMSAVLDVLANMGLCPTNNAAAVKALRQKWGARPTRERHLIMPRPTGEEKDEHL